MSGPGEPRRPAIAPSTREEIVGDLHRSRLEIMLRNHTWDVADVMAVLDEHLEYEHLP